MKAYKVVIEPDEGGWWMAYIPSVQGCRTQAKSVSSAKRRIRDALELFVNDARTAPLEFELKVSKELRQAVERYKHETEIAKLHFAKAQEFLEKAAELAQERFSLREASEMLGLSHQYIAQVVARRQRGHTHGSTHRATSDTSREVRVSGRERA